MVMPIYKFSCVKCGHIFEELTTIERRETVRCSECGGEVRRAYEGKSVFGIGAIKDCPETGVPCGGDCPGCCCKNS